MKFYNIYYTCKIALKGLEDIGGENVSGGTRLNGWNTTKQALESLFTIDFIKSDAEKLYNILSPIDREAQRPVIGTNTFNTFSPRYNKLIAKLESVVDLYESMRDGISQPGIDIKIPKCKDLKGYIDILRDIDFILTQCPYLQDDEEKLQYNGTDVGSDWVSFAVITGSIATSSFIILNNFAALISKAISIKSNKTVLDMQDEMLKTMQSKNEVTQETIDAFKTMKTLTYQKYVDELKDELGPVENGEEEGKVSKSLEKLSNIIDKGVEIYSSIETPKEIKVLFPFSENQDMLPDNLIKYLEDKQSDSFAD